MKYNHAHHTNVHTHVSPIKDFDRLRQGQHFRFNKIEENELFKYLNRYKTLLSFNANCTHLVPIHIKKYKCGYFRKDTFWYIISKICSFSSTFVLHWSTVVNVTMLHYTPKKWMRSFFLLLLLLVQFHRSGGTEPRTSSAMTLFCLFSSSLDSILYHHHHLRSPSLITPRNTSSSPSNCSSLAFWISFLFNVQSFNQFSPLSR